MNFYKAVEEWPEDTRIIEDPAATVRKVLLAAGPAVKGRRGGTSGGRGSLEAPGMSEAAKQRGTR